MSAYRVLFFTCFLVLLTCSCLLCASLGPNLLVNPSFESNMDGWNTMVGGNAKTTASIDKSVSHSGKASVGLTNQSGYAPNVYGSIYQDVGGLIPGNRYSISFWAKGKNVHNCWYGGGPGWFIRRNLPSGDFDWTRVELEVTVAENSSVFNFRVNVDDVTDALWLDDFSFKEIDPIDASPRITTLSVDNAPKYGIWPMTRVSQAPKIDGDLSDWKSRSSVIDIPGAVGNNLVGGWNGPNDLSVQAKAAYDRTALYFSFAVTDDRAWAPKDILPWNGDSIQIAIDPKLERTPGAYGPLDVEYTLALTNDGTSRYNASRVPETGSAYKDVQFAASRSGNITYYEVAIPFTSLGITSEQCKHGIGFTFLVNDNDGQDRRGYLELTPGIGKTKNPSVYSMLIASDSAALMLQPYTTETGRDSRLPMTAAFYNPYCETSESKLAVEVNGTGSKWSKVVNLPKSPFNTVILAVPADSLKPGQAFLSCKIESAARLDISPVNIPLTIMSSGTDIKKRATALKKPLAVAQQLAAKAKSRHIATDYEDVAIETVNRFIGYAIDDVNNGRIGRAEHVVAVLESTIKESTGNLRDYLSGKRKPFTVPRFVTSPVEVRDGAFWADTVVPTTGKRQRRPVFFTGYGHFSNAIADIPNFPKLGCNIIQFELGPTSTQPSENVVTNAEVKDRVLPALKNGEKYNVMSCLLLSPHYFPGWAFQKWAQVRTGYEGFLSVATDAPQARDIYRKHAETVFDTIGGNPALHSVCLSNEPTSTGWETDQYRRALWPGYLNRVYGTIESLNKINSTAYESFESVPVNFTKGLPAEEQMTPLIYDQIRFNAERFTDFHAYLSTLVHILRPGTPTHAKVMCMTDNRNFLAWGCDIEKFAGIGDLNGNDCYHMWNAWGEKYACNWASQNRYYDVQYSLRNVPVFNTEDHIIADRETRLIPAVHTDCAMWMGAIHGQGAATIWVWERTYQKESDFEGSILHRPENVMAVGRAGLDLMRLAPEVTRLQQAKSPIAILYSTTAQIWSQRAHTAMCKAHEALTFAGYPVRFISELQTCEGKLDKYRVVVLPSVRHIPDSVVSALRKFTANGGKLWIIGDEEFGKDEHGQARQKVSFPANSIARFQEDTAQVNLRNQFLAEMKRLNIAPSVQIKTVDNRNTWAVEYRSDKLGNRTIVSAVNYWGVSKKVKITVSGRSPKQMMDMRTGKYYSGNELILKPLQAVLLEM